MRRLSLAAAAALLLILPACGAKPGAGAAEVLTATLDGRPVSKLGFGSEGGEKPAIAARKAGGFALAYVGTRVGDRHVYVTTSKDGQAWSKPAAVAAGDYSDAAPALAEDASGTLHLYFASNRSGETQALYHASQTAGAWGEATEVPGFEGVQDVAAAATPAGITVACEVMGAGLLAASAADGAAFAEPSSVSEAGAEPAACALPDGRVLLAFQREGKIWGRAGKPGAWEAEAELAAGSSRLRDPALAWSGATGTLYFSEKGSEGFALHARSLDSKLQPLDAVAPKTGPGDARGAAIAIDPHGSKLLAWGMKTPNGQQGVMVTRR